MTVWLIDFIYLTVVAFQEMHEIPRTYTPKTDLQKDACEIRFGLRIVASPGSLKAYPMMCVREGKTSK